jgi:hypothetical protein
MYPLHCVVVLVVYLQTVHKQQNGVLTLVKRTGGDKTTIQLSDDDTFVNGIATALDDIHTTLWNEGTAIMLYISCILYHVVVFTCTVQTHVLHAQAAINW